MVKKKMRQPVEIRKKLGPDALYQLPRPKKGPKEIEIPRTGERNSGNSEYLLNF